MGFSTTPTLFFPANTGRAFCAVSQGVEFERTTTRTESERWASWPASETGTAGGESITIPSNSASIPCRNLFRRPFAMSSAGCAGRWPHAMKNRFSIGPRCMIENSSLSPIR
jgi:hypothetical protein